MSLDKPMIDDKQELLDEHKDIVSEFSSELNHFKQVVMSSLHDQKEKKIVSDTDERLAHSQNIDKKLMDLDHDIDDHLVEVIDQKRLALSSIDKKLAKLQENSPEKKLTMDDDTKKTNKKTQNPISALNISQSIRDDIGDENPLANQGRADSYVNVEDFKNSVVSQGGVLGTIASWLS